MDDEIRFPSEEGEGWPGKAPTSLVVASVLSGIAQILKALFMLAVDLGALGATIYFAVEGRWGLFALMLVVGISFVAGVADIASGIVIAPFVLAEAWMQRRAQRALDERGRFTLPHVARQEPEVSGGVYEAVAAAACPNGHEIQSGAKYCPECGAAVLPPSAPEPEAALDDTGTLPVVSAAEPSSIFEAPPPRRRRKRLLIGGGVAAVAVVGIVAATSLSGGGKGNSSSPPAKAAAVVPTKPKRKPKPAPTRYPQLLAAGMTKQRAAAPLCSTYKATIARWQQAEQERTAAMQGVSSTDPYASFDLVHKPGTGWLHADTEQALTAAITAASRTRLSALAGPKRRYMTIEIVNSFRNDMLYLCGEGAAWRQTLAALTQLDNRTAAIVSEAANKPWYPQGYAPYGGDSSIAVKWDNNISKCQDQYGVGGEYCWGMFIISRDGCPSSIYAEISILQGNAVIDYSNDVLSGLDPGQVGELAFKAYENTSGQLTGQLKQVNCY